MSNNLNKAMIALELMVDSVCDEYAYIPITRNEMEDANKELSSIFSLINALREWNNASDRQDRERTELLLAQLFDEYDAKYRTS